MRGMVLENFQHPGSLQRIKEGVSNWKVVVFSAVLCLMS